MPRTLQVGQTCEVHVVTLTPDGPADECLLTVDDLLLEAPNWSLDDAALILNGDGRLWRLELESHALTPIEIDVPELNNDHVLDPDGSHIFLSAMDGQIYRADLAGGPAVKVTDDRFGDGFFHFLHGVSPAGDELAWIGLRFDRTSGNGSASIPEVFTTSLVTGDVRQLTGTGRPADGSEYSPDGEWIYFNTEQFSEVPGAAQLARMHTDGSGVEQLTSDDAVNWFPHLSLDGQWGVHIAFPAGTLGHPADLPVRLNVVRPEVDGWQVPVASIELFGGQGTINVNSWSPSSGAFAYVSYPLGATP